MYMANFWPFFGGGRVLAIFGPCIAPGAIYGPSIPGTRSVLSGSGRRWPVLAGFAAVWSQNGRIRTLPNTRRGPG